MEKRKWLWKNLVKKIVDINCEKFFGKICEKIVEKIPQFLQKFFPNFFHNFSRNFSTIFHYYIFFPQFFSNCFWVSGFHLRYRHFSAQYEMRDFIRPNITFELKFSTSVVRPDPWCIQIIIKVFSLIKYFLSNKNLTSPILTLIINQTVINKS